MNKINKITILLFTILTCSTSLFSQTRSLDYYVSNAIKNSPRINDQRGAIDSARLDIQLSKAKLTRPLITGTADYLYAPTYGKYGFDTNITDGGHYAALLNLEYPLLHFRKLAVQKHAGQAAERKSRYNIQLLGHEIRTSVTDQYISAYQNLAHVQYLEDIIKLLHKQKQVLQPLVQNGLIHVTELQQIDIKIQDLLIQKSTAEDEYRASLSQLNAMSGVNDSLTARIEPPQISRDTTRIDQSLFLRQFRLDSLQLALEKKVQDMKYRPDLSLMTSAGLDATQPSGLKHNYGYTVGLHFSALLYDGNQKDIQRQKITVAQRSIAGHRSHLENQRATRLQSLRAQLDHVKSQLASLSQQKKRYQNLLDTYNAELSSGDVSVIDYLSVVRDFLDFRDQQQQLQTTQYQLMNQYNYWHW